MEGIGYKPNTQSCNKLIQVYELSGESKDIARTH